MRAAVALIVWIALFLWAVAAVGILTNKTAHAELIFESDLEEPITETLELSPVVAPKCTCAEGVEKNPPEEGEDTLETRALERENERAIIWAELGG